MLCGLATKDPGELKCLFGVPRHKYCVLKTETVSMMITSYDTEDSPHRCPPLLSFLATSFILEIDHDPDWVPQSYPNNILNRIRHGRREQMRSTLLG